MDGKVSTKNKLAFACGDIFGGGSFNVINFLFTPFLTLVVGIPMIYLFPILLFTKLWDGVIDPFIGRITDAMRPNKYGKRRWFMVVFAPFVLVGLVLLFFPWNIVTSNLLAKIIFVIISYVMYATAQSFVLIPYYSLASEMTSDYNERNRTNAVRLAFSLASSIVCIVVPGIIASPTIEHSGFSYAVITALFGKTLGEEYFAKGASYVLMSLIFGTVFMLSVWITAFFSREQIITPPVKTKISLQRFFRPLKLRTYRQYLGMQMCTSMGMAIMSSFFFIFCDFYLRKNTYRQLTLLNTALGTDGYTRFTIATVAAALMFVMQIFALPLYVKLIKAKSKRFAYLTGATLWIVCCIVMMFLPCDTGSVVTRELVTEGGNIVSKGYIESVGGTADWVIIMMGCILGLAIGGAMYVPHSSFGDVCDVGELYFGERTEGEFSGLTNFLNTSAQALGLALPPLLTGIAGYIETDYVSLEQYNAMSSEVLSNYAVTVSNDGTVVKLLPVTQSDGAQLAIRIAFTLVPLVIMAIGIVIASRYKLTKQLQQRIVEVNKLDKDSDEYKQERQDILSQL